jgi:SAM-dependent methyltransferase
MPTEWFATHAAGFGPLAARLAARDLPGSTVQADGDNALRISSQAEPRAVLAYCRALFRVLGEEPGGLERAARAFRGGAHGPGVSFRRAGGTFVLRAFGPDDPASIPVESRRAIEALIARATGMRPDSGRSGSEYRLQERADGRVLFLERVAASRAEPEPRRGELPRTTCRLLAEMTGPESDDVFLDPFCGYGGIVLERVLAAPCRFAFASDTDAEKITAVKAELSTKAFEKRRRTFFPKTRDALDSSAFEAGFVTAIATDPPWGLYEGGMDASEAEALLGSFMSEAARLLAPGGRLVLLVSRALSDRAFADLFGETFVRRECLDVLVSGKKARALRFDRT